MAKTIHNPHRLAVNNFLKSRLSFSAVSVRAVFATFFKNTVSIEKCWRTSLKNKCKYWHARKIPRILFLAALHFFVLSWSASSIKAEGNDNAHFSPDEVIQEYENSISQIKTAGFVFVFEDGTDLFPENKIFVDIGHKKIKSTSIIESESLNYFSETLCSPTRYLYLDLTAESHFDWFLSSKTEIHEQEWLQLLQSYYISIFLGYVPEIDDDNGYLPSLLRKAQCVVERKNANGKKAIVLTGHSKDGEIAVYFDEKNNWTPVRLELRKRLQDSSYRELDYISFEMKQFDSFDGVFFPRRCEFISHYTAGHSIYSKNIPEESLDLLEAGVSSFSIPINVKRTIHFRHVEFNKMYDEASFCFSKPIPDGTPVHMEDAPHLDFIWEDGKIVPLTDEAVLTLRGQKFLGGPTTPRFWFTFIGILMIFVALTHKSYMFLKNRKGVTE